MSKTVEINKFLEPAKLGEWNLQSHVAMAPLTRCFADLDTGIVGEDVVEYYRKRAADGVGLIITEGIVISQRGRGNPGVSGLYSNEQIAAWKKVTDAVHAEGGTIVAQIWHVGRLSHHELTGGVAPLAPSAIQAQGDVSRLGKPFSMPEEMSEQDIQQVLDQYAQAAQNALAAGFDGVEIHGANGYLIDQFNTDLTNQRTDRYGGDLKQRLTFMKEVIRTVIDVVGTKRTIIRFSAMKVDNLAYMWEDPEQAIATFMDAFKEVGVTNIHLSIVDFTQVVANGMTLNQLVRKYWDKVIIGVGSITPQIAEDALQEGLIDLAAIGRPLIANPDYVHRVKNGMTLEDYDVQQLFTLV
ncbi:alkene reductase [Hazenella sp. IB182357]|uniref:Alkene reductase n=1 Tax=Polycladospora coralii TaxID=2771432 RepID=A0A926NBK4_9BACL|nr:alkene reductase [Polycladospora coralii]